MALLTTLNDLQFWQIRECENPKHCKPSEKSHGVFSLHHPTQAPELALLLKQ